MVFSGDLLKETYSKFKPDYTCWFDKSTWKYLDKYQVLCLQVQVSTKYFWISKCQVQVSTKYSRFCIKYQVSSTSTLLDPNPDIHTVFLCLVLLYFKQTFIEVCCKSPIENNSATGSSNGLATNRWQTIDWTYDDPIHWCHSNGLV